MFDVGQREHAWRTMEGPPEGMPWFRCLEHHASAQAAMSGGN